MTVSRYDFVVLGATGVTGVKVCHYLARTQQTDHNLSWAIAGRRSAALDYIINQLTTQYPSSLKGITIGKIICDVESKETLVAMAHQAKVVLQLVGPYSRLGLPIAAACIEGGANVVDVSGEPLYLESCELEFHQKALSAGVTIVGSSGFDSVPCDVGTLVLQREFGRRNAVCAHIDSFLTAFPCPKNGYCAHSTTFVCAVEGFHAARQGKLTTLRKQAAALFPRAQAVLRLPSNAYSGGGSRSLLPFRDSTRTGSKFILPFLGSDASVVKRTQARMQSENPAGSMFIKPALATSYAAYFTLSGLWSVAFLMLVGTWCGLLSLFAFGRYLLITYPHIFTCGLFTHHGPTDAQLAGTTFQMELFGLGVGAQNYCADADAENQKKGAAAPVVVTHKIKLVVRGPEAGYVATPIYMVNIGRAVLDGRAPKGVVTPALALRDPQTLDTFLARVRKENCTFDVEN